MKRIAAFVIFSLLVIASSGNAWANTREQQIKQRVCERIEKRFRNDEKMKERINQRVSRRFGFVCALDVKQKESKHIPAVESVQAVSQKQIWINFAKVIAPIFPIKHDHSTVLMRENPNDRTGMILHIASIEHDATEKIYEGVFGKKIVVNDGNTLKINLEEPMQACTKVDVKIRDIPFVDGSIFSGIYTVDGYRITVERGRMEISSRSDPEFVERVMQGQKDILALSLEVTASCDRDYQLNRILLSHEGTGSSYDIDRLSVVVHEGESGEENRFLIEDGFGMSFDPPVFLESCETRIIDVFVDIAETAEVTKTHQFSVVNASNVEGLANIESSRNAPPSFCSDAGDALVSISLPAKGPIIDVSWFGK